MAWKMPFIKKLVLDMRSKCADFEEDLNNKNVAGTGYRWKELPRLSKE